MTVLIREEVPVSPVVSVEEEVRVLQAISPVAPPATKPCHRRASLGLELERSLTQEADLDRLRAKYAIPDEFRMTVPYLDERVISPPP